MPNRSDDQIRNSANVHLQGAPQFAESPTRDILILEVTSSKEVMILEVPPESAFSFLGKYEAPATARPQNFFQALSRNRGK